MTTHTKEPWSVVSTATAATVPIIQEGHDAIVATVDAAEAEDGANLRRIVACVNACAGIPTEALETGVLDGFKATLAAMDRSKMRVQIYPIDQDTGERGPLHWEGEFNAEVIEDDEERAEVRAKLRASGEARVGGGAMPLVLILRADG